MVSHQHCGQASFQRGLAIVSTPAILDAARKLKTISTMTTMRSISTLPMVQWKEEHADESKPDMPTGTILLHLLQNQISKKQTSQRVMQSKLQAANDEIALLNQVIEGKDAAFRFTQEAWIMSETNQVQKQMSDFAQSIVEDCDDDSSPCVKKLREEFLTTDAFYGSSSDSSSLDGDSSDSDTSSYTDATSLCESDVVYSEIHCAGNGLNKALLFVRKLKRELVEQLAKVDDYKTRLETRIRNRRQDYEKVLSYSAAMENMETDYDAMEKDMREKLEVKEQQLQLLKTSNKDLEHSQMHMAHKHNQAVEEMKHELEKARKQGQDVLEQAKSEHSKEQKTLMDATLTNQEKTRSDIAFLQSRARCLESEIKDNATHAETEIQSLTARNLQLQDELTALKQCKNQGFVYPEQTNAMLASGAAVREQLSDVKNKLRIAKNDNEALLDHAQRDLNQVNHHLEREQAAQKKSVALEHKITELEETIERKNDRIRHLLSDNADEPRDGSCAVEEVNRNPPVLHTRSFSLFVALRENEELRAMLATQQEAKAAAEEKASKLEDEVFQREVEEQFVTADKHKTNQKICDLEQTCDSQKRTIFSLEDAVFQCNNLSGSAKWFLEKRLHEYKQEIERLRARQRPLEEELEDAKHQVRTIENRLDSKIKQLEGWVELWCSSYYEILNQQARLHEKIAELMKEKGENYYVESEHPFNKAVADRNALRTACMFNVPVGVAFEDQWPGAIPATYVALQRLRPLGWGAIQELGKVWLTPVVKPYTEEDALERHEALAEAERMAHRRNMGFPVGESRPELVVGNAAPQNTITSYASQPQPVKNNKRLRRIGQSNAARPRQAQKSSMALGIDKYTSNLSYDDHAQNFRSKKAYNAMTRGQKREYQQYMLENGLARKENT